MSLKMTLGYSQSPPCLPILSLKEGIPPPRVILRREWSVGHGYAASKLAAGEFAAYSFSPSRPLSFPPL